MRKTALYVDKRQVAQSFFNPVLSSKKVNRKSYFHTVQTQLIQSLLYALNRMQFF